MITINLLPWRELKRNQEKKYFIRGLWIVAMTALLLVLLINYGISLKINKQMTRNQLLQQEITVLESRIKEIKVLKARCDEYSSQIGLLEDLLSTRTLMVHLFDELIKIVPLDINITKVERQNTMISLWGYAKSHTSISFLMKSIEHSSWFQQPYLIELRNKSLVNNEFKLNFVFKLKEHFRH